MQTDPQDTIRGLEIFEKHGGNVFVKGARHGRPFMDVVFTVGMSFFESILLRKPFWDINAQPTMFPRAFFERVKAIAEQSPTLAAQIKRWLHIPVLWDLDQRVRMMRRWPGYQQVLTLKGNVLRIHGTDITPLKRAEEALRRANAQLREADQRMSAAISAERTAASSGRGAHPAATASSTPSPPASRPRMRPLLGFRIRRPRPATGRRGTIVARVRLGRAARRAAPALRPRRPG